MFYRKVSTRDFFCPDNWTKTSLNGVIIGKLLFTSLFATASYNEKPFFVYQIIPVPFNHTNKRVRLAQMPAYIGIHPGSCQFIRWSQEEATPAIEKNLEGTCIYQILTDASLTACRIEPYPEPVVVRRLGHYWVVSPTSTTKCNSTAISDPFFQTIIRYYEEHLTVKRVR